MRLAALAEVRQGMVMAGRGAGARPGDWVLQVVESADIIDNRASLEGLRSVQVKRDHHSEAHLLQPLDILVTARSQPAKVALVPPGVSLTVAAVTLLVVRTPDPGAGLAHFLWYYLASERGRVDIASSLTGTSQPTLSVTALGDLQVPVPPPAELRRLGALIEATEASRGAAAGAMRVRHDVLRDAIVEELRAFDEVERSVYVAEIGKIAARDSNVDITEPIEVPSVGEALAQLREAERHRNEGAARMDDLLGELGYAAEDHGRHPGG